MLLCRSFAYHGTLMSFLEEKFGDWKPVSRLVGIAWVSFYALFLLYAFTNRSGFLFLAYALLHNSIGVVETSEAGGIGESGEQEEGVESDPCKCDKAGV